MYGIYKGVRQQILRFIFKIIGVLLYYNTDHSPDIKFERE